MHTRGEYHGMYTAANKRIHYGSVIVSTPEHIQFIEQDAIRLIGGSPNLDACQTIEFTPCRVVQESPEDRHDLPYV